MIPDNTTVKVKSSGATGRISTFVKEVNKYLVFLDSGIAILENEDNIAVIDHAEVK